MKGKAIVPLISQKMDTLNPVLMSICVGADVIKKLEKGVEKKSWKVDFSHFDAYISASRRPHFGPLMRSSNVYIAFVDFDKDPDQAVESAQYLVQIFAGRVTVVALTKSQEAGLILKAMRAGCTELLNKPVQENALSELFHRMEEHWAANRESYLQTGQVICFLGAKGGVGSTTLAIHLATYIARVHQKKTLLIDHYAEMGHACVYLGLDGSRCHFQEVVRNVSRLDSELLQGFLARHSSGLDVLSSPDVIGSSRFLDTDSITKTLDFLRSEYDYVILDCDIAYENRNLPVLALAESIYIVATPEVGAIRDLSRYIDKFVVQDHTMNKLQLVINRTSSADGIPLEQIEKAVKLPISMQLPDGGPEVARAGNLGEPVSPSGKSPFAEKILEWADSMVGAVRDRGPMKKRRSLFSVWT